MSRLVVFDVDGTILDSFGHYAKAVAEYSAANNLPHPCLDTIKLGYGAPHAHDFKWGVSREDQYRHLMGTFEMSSGWETSGDPLKKPALFDGVADMLADLKTLGYVIGIVTSRPSDALVHTLEHHGVLHYFSGVRTSCDIKRRGEREKPEPDQLQSVMRELSFDPKDTVMIGDTVMDIKMGRAAGTHTIGVTWGVHPRDHLEQAGAHHIIDSHVADIKEFLRKIF
jgi:phosphoglycolate phosphatase